jgi:hypothetical protein
MSGALLSLIAYGSQDVYLTSQPEISFFRSTYKRYSSFATESIGQTLSGSVDWSRRLAATVARNGDLVSQCWVEITMKKLDNTHFFCAEQVLKEVEVELGGQKLDRYTNTFARAFNELFQKADEKAAYRRLVDFSAEDGVGTIKKFYVPLLFWFNRSVGCSIPLVALAYHELKIFITLGACPVGVDPTYKPTLSLYCNYIYLDSEERKAVAARTSEMLIEQVQYSGPETIAPKSTASTVNIRLAYNHPTKYLIVVAKNPAVDGLFTAGTPIADVPAGYSLVPHNEKASVINTLKLQLNGMDRQSIRNGAFYGSFTALQTVKSNPQAGIYLIPFALRPDDIHQPSGSINLSRIDNVSLSVGLKACTAADLANVLSDDTTLTAGTNLTELSVFCVSHNILRILSGMGGVAYSS